MKNAVFMLAVAVCLLPLPAWSQGSGGTFVNFESSQTNPARLSPSGARLFVVNTPDAQVSVFDVSTPANPKLIAEIPVGIDPVAVNPRNDDEAWVVNQESNSVSVISVSAGIVTDTIQAKPEPVDVVFAGGLAWVSVSRNNYINAYDLNTHALVTSLSVFGGNPRVMAVSPDGSKVYAAMALSGNATTIIPVPQAPPPPPPTNPKLPPAPPQGVIVSATDPAWSSYIKFTMPDNDVVEIDAASKTVTRYFTGVGTINMGLAVNPKNGDLYVANMDALNLVRFETNLRGHFVNNRMTQIAYSSGKVTAYDLNPGIDYSILPNPKALSTALAMPTGTVFDPSGSFMWVAAFGTDRVAKVSTNGTVLARIEIGNTPGTKVDSKNKRGPRGLVLNGQNLYVVNRLSNTLSVVNTSSLQVTSEIAIGTYDPTPDVIKMGRGFLYDAKLSGNGTGSCSSCHIDADMDHLAWDLGNPGGTITKVTDPVPVSLHPMKGPMTTLALRGLVNIQPYHWRGDKTNFQAFNAAFDGLMGGSQLSTDDMNAYTNFINTVAFLPNPNQNLDRSLPATIAGASPAAGQDIFRHQPFAVGIVTCGLCHFDPGTGTDKLIIPGVILLQPQAFKTPQIRNMYQKLWFNNRPGAQTIDGVGLLHDGSKAGSFEFLSDPVFGSFSNNTPIQAELNAFMQCFDTGVAPAVGYALTVTDANVNNGTIVTNWATLESRAVVGDNDLIIKGTINGQVHGLLYQPSTNNYQTDTSGLGPFTHAQLVSFITTNHDIMTPMGVPKGAGNWMGINPSNQGFH